VKRPFQSWWVENADHHNIYKLYMKTYFNKLFDFISHINKFNSKHSGLYLLSQLKASPWDNTFIHFYNILSKPKTIYNKDEKSKCEVRT